MRTLLKILGAALVLLLLACGCAGYVAHTFLSTAPETPGRELYVDVAPGASVSRLAATLEKQGVITNARYFTYLARYHRVDGKLKAGRFILHTGWRPGQVLDMLVNGKPVLYRVTIPEGLTIWQTAALLEEKGFVNREAFLGVLKDPAFLRNFGIPFETAEGFLMPDTYLLKHEEQTAIEEAARQAEAARNVQAAGNAEASGNGERVSQDTTGSGRDTSAENPAGNAESSASGSASGALPGTAEKKAPSITEIHARKIAARLVDAFWRRGDTVWPGGRRPGREDLKRYVILASIVEKETAVPAERARVAGVYQNRLNIGMLLQADPTVIYGLGPTFSGRLLYRHLDDRKNLYNTYQHMGLPPGPICSFGVEALRAAISPEKHRFLYFVAKTDRGAHTFSENLKDHNRAVQEYRKNRQKKQ